MQSNFRRRRWPYLVVILVACLAAVYYWLPGREVFVVPIGYQGPVVVFFSHPDGVEVPWDWWNRTYKIPKNGVLLVKNPLPTGFQMTLWVYGDEHGNLREIPSQRYAAENNITNSPVVAGAGVASSQYAEEGDGQYSGKKGRLAYHFVTAQIGTPSTVGSFGTQHPVELAEKIIEDLRKRH